MAEQPISVARVDFDDPRHAEAYLAMLDAYARDPLGDGAPLAPEVRRRLIDGLRRHPTALAWLAWREDQPVGVVTAFVGFSTFGARPLVNLHDVAVAGGHRGQGIGWQLLDAVEQYARQNDCCALTLEVRGDNHPAQRLYRRFGFRGATTLDPPGGMAFWKKRLV